MKLISFTLTFALLFSLPAFADGTLLQQQLVSNLEFFRGIYRTEYAMYDWKRAHLGWDLDREIQASEAVTMGTPSLNVYGARDIVRRFISSMSDYHVSVSFFATEKATLPLGIKGAGGHFFLSWIDRTKLPETSFPFHEGDEVTRFGGKPTGQAVAEIMSWYAPNNSDTDRMRAEQRLTARGAAGGQPVPRGQVVLSIVPKTGGGEQSFGLAWEYTPETIPPGPLRAGRAPTSPLLSPMMNVEVDSFTPSRGPKADNPNIIGARNTFTPELGPITWQTADTDLFYAYEFTRPSGRKIGYIRLGTFAPTDYVAAVAAFATIIRKLQAETDMLVIDEVNNPGGGVLYLYEIASMLAIQPLRTPQHEIVLDQKLMLEANTLITKLQGVHNDAEAQAVLGQYAQGYPISYSYSQLELQWYQTLLSEWTAGRRLTRPLWWGGVNQINPSPVRYTKPLLVMVNSLDFSCGDFFPAILQDNRRAVIMGTRTAGAGGVVWDVPFLNSIDVEKVRITGSIAKRVDDNPIENLGVTPNILLPPTVRDLRENYVDYVAGIQRTIDAMVR